jgi:hypothetical protein
MISSLLVAATAAFLLVPGVNITTSISQRVVTMAHWWPISPAEHLTGPRSLDNADPVVRPSSGGQASVVERLSPGHVSPTDSDSDDKIVAIYNVTAQHRTSPLCKRWRRMQQDEDSVRIGRKLEKLHCDLASEQHNVSPGPPRRAGKRCAKVSRMHDILQ